MHRVLRGSRLFGCESAEWGEHSPIHRSRKVQEYAGDLLDKFLPGLIERGGAVVWLCMFDFCPILFFDLWVRLVLRHNWRGMLELFECVFEVERHRYVHLLARIVPFDGESAVSFPFWFEQALIIFLHLL